MAVFKMRKFDIIKNVDILIDERSNIKGRKMATEENQKLVSQREVFEKCLDIVNNPNVEIKHLTSTPHYSAWLGNKRIFTVYKNGPHFDIDINDVLFDSVAGENRKFVSDLFDKVVAKYAEQENSRNRTALNFLNSLPFIKQK